MTAPKIDSYQFGRIVIDGKAHHRDVILLPDGVLGNWWRESGHRLQVADLAAVLASTPRVLVVGLGASSQMNIAPATRRILDETGIELVALPTQEACETYNALRQEGDVAAALHLTC